MCGLARDRFSLCTQQLKWWAVDELSLIVSYVMSTAAVGRVILDYCCINSAACTGVPGGLVGCPLALF